MKRGRKSAAEMSVVPIIGLAAQRPEPPAELTAEQAKVWRETVESAPPRWFRPSDHLLTAYCRHVVTSNMLSTVIDGENLALERECLGRIALLLSMRNRESNMVIALARAMRLTNQARMHPRSAGRAFGDMPPAGPKLWER